MQGTSDSNPELLDAMALCGHLVARDSVHWFLAEHRQRLFPDDMFGDLFGSGRGRPSVPADVIATVMVLQALEGLSDREAINQLRNSISWKVAAGRSLADEGFHPTVLTLWRNKLRLSDRPQRIFDAEREVINAANVLAGKTRRALDSTVLDDAVTRQDAIMQLVAQIRRARRLIPAARALALSAHDYDNDAGKPACAWNDRGDIDRVVTELVNDARTILAVLDGVELDDIQAEAVGLLALVAGQDVEPGDSDGTWRIAQVTRPDRMVSVHDPESRHVHKTTSNYRDGFKAHIGIEPDTGLITACALTAGNVGDAQAAPGLLAEETEPVEVLADSAYGSGEFGNHLAGQGHTATIKPIPLQPAIPNGFTIDDFTVNTTAATITCPNGITTGSAHAAMRRSERNVEAVRCAIDAPLLPVAATSSSMNTTICSPRHEPTLAPQRSRSHTASTAQWSSGPLPGSSATAAAKSATEASAATGSASLTAALRSTCSASSTSASPGTTHGQSPHEPADPGLTTAKRHPQCLTQPSTTRSYPPTQARRLSLAGEPTLQHHNITPSEKATCSAVS